MVVAAAVASGAWLALTAVADTDGVVAADPDRPVISAGVAATGVPFGTPAGWRAERTDVGRYQLSFDRRVELRVGSFEAMATVNVNPVTDGVWEIEFVDGHAMVDTAFSFTAVPLP